MTDRTCRGSSITPRKQVTRTPSSGTDRRPDETRHALAPTARRSPTSVSCSSIDDRFAPGERAELLAQYAIECYTIGAIDKAVKAGQRAVEENRSLGDLRQLGACLRWLSRIWWMAGNRANAEQAGREAISVLERAGDSRLLALALSNESQLCMRSPTASPRASSTASAPRRWPVRWAMRRLRRTP